MFFNSYKGLEKVGSCMLFSTAANVVVTQNSINAAKKKKQLAMCISK